MKSVSSSAKDFTNNVACGFFWILTPFAAVIQLIGFIPSICIRILYRLRRLIFLLYFILAFLVYVAPRASELSMPYPEFLKTYFLSGAFLTDKKGGTALVISFICVLVLRFMITRLLLLADWLDDHTQLLSLCLSKIFSLHDERNCILFEKPFEDYIAYERSIMMDFRKKYPNIVKNVPINASNQ